MAKVDFEKDQAVPPRSVHAAWQLSCFGSLEAATQSELQRNAISLSVPAGQTIYRGSGKPRLALIVSGLARVLISSPEGRRATIRYARSGDFTGMISVVTQRQVVDSEAVNDCEVLFLNVDNVTRVATGDSTVAWAIAREAGTVTSEVIDISATNVFGSVRRRVAWHLLDLAQTTESGLVVKADQQDIADSIGSVREVIARALRTLREDGYIGRTTHAGISVLNPAALHLVATGRD